MFNKNRLTKEPKIKLARHYVEHLINKNNNSKRTYTLSKSDSYLARWKDKQDREDLAYKKRR